MTTRDSTRPESKPINLDRRRFLSHAGTGLGVVLANPKLGLLSAALGGGALAQAKQSFEIEQGPRQTPSFEPLSVSRIEGALASATDSTKSRWVLPPHVKATRLLRSAEPINIHGVPFGYGAGIPAALLLPVQPTEAGRAGVCVAIPHSAMRTADGLSRDLMHQSLGVSTIELVYETGRGWRHKISTHRNRCWNAQTPIVLDGYLNCERISRDASGLWATAAATITPWNTVLLVETKWQDQWKLLSPENDIENDVGYIAEINLSTGTLIKRLAIGRLNAQALAVACHPGRNGSLYILGERLFRFVSQQYFDGRHLNSNSDLWNAGTLFAADLENHKWVPFTFDEGTPIGGDIDASRGSMSLSYDEKNQTLLGVWGGSIFQIKELLDDQPNDQGALNFAITPYPLNRNSLPDWVTGINQIILDRRGDAWISASGDGHCIIGFVPTSNHQKSVFSILAVRPSLQRAHLAFLPGTTDLLVCAGKGSSVSELWVFEGLDSAAKTKPLK